MIQTGRKYKRGTIQYNSRQKYRIKKKAGNNQNSSTGSHGDEKMGHVGTNTVQKTNKQGVGGRNSKNVESEKGGRQDMTFSAEE